MVAEAYNAERRQLFPMVDHEVLNEMVDSGRWVPNPALQREEEEEVAQIRRMGYG